MASSPKTASGTGNTSRDQLPRSFWFIAICGFVTGGFVALGERGEQMATANAQRSVATPGKPGVKDERWRVPPPVSSQVASAGISVPVSAPTTTVPVNVKGAKVENLGTNTTSPSSRLGVVMLIMGVLGAAALWAAKKRGGVFGESAEKQLAVVETTRIGGRFQVALVKAPGRMLVLGASEKGLTLLTELEVDTEDGVNIPTFDVALQAAGLPEAPEVSVPPAVSPTHGQYQRPVPSLGASNNPARQVDSPSPDSSPEMGERFLDSLVERLNAAKPKGIDTALEQPTPAGGPLARYRRSLA